MSLISPLVIEGPLERKGVRTPEAYRAFQQRIISSNRLARPDLEWQGPWRATDQPPVYIGAGTSGRLGVLERAVAVVDRLGFGFQFVRAKIPRIVVFEFSKRHKIAFKFRH